MTVKFPLVCCKVTVEVFPGDENPLCGIPEGTTPILGFPVGGVENSPRANRYGVVSEQPV